MKKQYKVDLHTHSIISHDGGIRKDQYKAILSSGTLDCIAITDHNETSFARSMHNDLGEKIIVGEEISTKDGEIIGLFLNKTIAPGQSAKETIYQIHQQDGLVYIPHPFETFRSGLQIETMEEIVKEIDIIETFNARGFLRGKPLEAFEFANKSALAMSASSDAHSRSGIGSAYNMIDKIPDKKSMCNLLKNGTSQREYAKWYSYFSPGFNKIKNKLVLGV